MAPSSGGGRARQKAPVASCLVKFVIETKERHTGRSASGDAPKLPSRLDMSLRRPLQCGCSPLATCSGSRTRSVATSTGKSLFSRELHNPAAKRTTYAPAMRTLGRRQRTPHVDSGCASHAARHGPASIFVGGTSARSSTLHPPQSCGRVRQHCIGHEPSSPKSRSRVDVSRNGFAAYARAGTLLLCHRANAMRCVQHAAISNEDRAEARRMLSRQRRVRGGQRCTDTLKQANTHLNTCALAHSLMHTAWMQLCVGPHGK